MNFCLTPITLGANKLNSAGFLMPITGILPAIIGAGSVIIKDVPDFATVVGNPGKIIKIKGDKYTHEQ